MHMLPVVLAVNDDDARLRAESEVLKGVDGNPDLAVGERGMRLGAD